MSINEGFSVPQSDALKLKGVCRMTLHNWRTAGLPFKRDERTGRIFFRQSDLDLYHRLRSK